MATETPIDPRERTRENIPEAFTWNLSDIYPSWSAWEAGLSEFERMLSGYAELRGTLAQGPARLLKVFRLGDDLGQLSYRIWYYAGLNYDQDQRDNSANARRQKVQILFAKAALKPDRGFTPELLRIPLGTVRAVDEHGPDLATYDSPSKARITSRSTCSTRKGSCSCRCRAASAMCRTMSTQCSPTQTSSIRSSRCMTARR